MSEEAREKMRAAWARRIAAGTPSPRLGMRHSDDTRARISKRMKERTPRGAEHYAWRGGITPGQKKKRKGRRYYAWRDEVRFRADGRCECCQMIRDKMFAHHLKPFATHPDLVLDPNNGAWLCGPCHVETHEACFGVRIGFAG
jgi:5-methylcytosine-specific restriction endonuclease McrA